MVVRTLLAVVLLLSAATANAVTFDDLLGEFRQRRSGVCVIYAHTLAIAEDNPDGFTALFHAIPGAWRVKLASRSFGYVTRKEIEQSIADRYSAGEPDNLITIYSIAVSKRTGGYDYLKCQLGYGPRDYSRYIGSGKWVLYDDSKGPGRSLSEGLDRLLREARPDGRPATPSTIGFGALDAKSIPELAELVRKHKLVGIHDFSVSRYDAATGKVLLRNPHNPRELLHIPIDLLRQIPAGIDFME